MVELNKDTKDSKLLDKLQKKYLDFEVSYTLLYRDSLKITPTVQILLLPQNRVSIQQILDRYEGKLKIAKPPYSGFYSLWVDKVKDAFDIANELNEKGLVKYAHPDLWVPVYKSFAPIDPLYNQQYYLNSSNNFHIRAEKAWDISRGTNNIVVAVIDDGVEDHPDLRDENGNTRISNGISLSGGTVGIDDFIAGGGPAGNGNIAHGMNCAGIIAASHNNIGIAGIAPNVRVFPVNIFTGGTNNATTTAGQIANAIRRSWQDGGASIISMSIGFGNANNPAPAFPALDNAINDAMTQGRNGQGVILVAATGNQGNSNTFIQNPASNTNIISVGASKPNGSMWAYSQGGSVLDLVAPSGDVNYLGDVKTTDRVGADGRGAGDYELSFGGTSAAAPQVAGVAALMLSANPNLLNLTTNKQVENILKQEALNLGHSSTLQGSGIVRACESVFEAMFLNLSITGQNIPSYGANIFLAGLKGITEQTTTWSIIDGAAKISGATSGTSYSPTLVPNNGATGDVTIRFTVTACNGNKLRTIDKVLTISTTTGNSICQNLANKCYKIKPVNSGLNLEVAGGGTVGGESIWQNYANNCGNQVYRVEQSNESQYCKITAQYAGGRSWQMSAAGGVNNVTIGAEVKNIDYNGNDSQKFFFSDAGGNTFHLSTKAVIDAFGGTNTNYHYVDVFGGNSNQFNKLSLWYRNGGDNQRFVFEETGCATSCSGNGGGGGGGGNTCGMSIASVGYNCNSNILEAVTVNGDGGAELQYRADAGPWYDYHFHIQFLSPGTHTFSVRKKYDTNCQATITSSICGGGGGGGGGASCPAAGCLSIGTVVYDCSNNLIETVVVSGGSGNYQYALDNCNVWKDYQFQIQQVSNGNHTLYVRDASNTNCGDVKAISISCNNVRQRTNEEVVSSIINTDENATSMEVFPNPATDEISAKFLIEKDKKTEISLVDISGKVYQKRDIKGTGVSQNETFTIKNLSAGQYFIYLKTDNINMTKKFVKE